MTLRSVSTQELEQELSRRKVGVPEAPQVRQNIVWDEVIKLCSNHLSSYVQDGRADEDDETYIYEVTMEAVFGESVWEYIKSVTTR